MIGEGTPHQRGDDRGDADDGTHETGEHGPFLQRDTAGDDHDRTGKDAAGTQPGNRPPDDEGRRTRGGAAHGRADLEQDDGGQKHPLGGVEGVEAAIEQLERAAGQQVAAAVPADVVEGVKSVGDAGNRRGDDCSILRALASDFLLTLI